MFEITLIERFPSGGSLISHVPCTDEAVETTAAELAKNEDQCVADKLLLSYTMIACYSYNLIYAQPRTLAVRV